MRTFAIIIFLLFVFSLSACGPTGASTPTVDAPGTFTAVAKTVFIEETAIPTETPIPTQPNTPIILNSPTLPATSTPSGPSPYPYITWTPSTCDKLQFVADVTIPDNSKLYPGTAFTKTWRVYNSGTCSWTKDYTLTYISGNKMGADTIHLSKTVAPGETVEISLNMTAPAIEEDYSNYWRMRNTAGTIFGDALYVVIEVTKNAKTLTPTVTQSSTAGTSTITSTPSNTGASTGLAPTSTVIPPTHTSIPPTETPSSVPITETPSSVPITETPSVETTILSEISYFERV